MCQILHYICAQRNTETHTHKRANHHPRRHVFCSDIIINNTNENSFFFFFFFFFEEYSYEMCYEKAAAATWTSLLRYGREEQHQRQQEQHHHHHHHHHHRVRKAALLGVATTTSLSMMMMLLSSPEIAFAEVTCNLVTPCTMPPPNGEPRYIMPSSQYDPAKDAEEKFMKQLEAKRNKTAATATAAVVEEEPKAVAPEAASE